MAFAVWRRTGLRDSHRDADRLGQRVGMSGGEALAGGARCIVRGRVGSRARESIAAALAKGDVACLAPLEDVASVIASDGDALLLARGPHGGQPLFFAWLDDDTLVASPELSLVTRYLAREPSWEALGECAAGLARRDPRATVHARVRRLGSGDVMLVTREGTRATTKLPEPESATWLTGDATGFAEELLRRIDVSIGREVEGARKVAVAVGGLDSCAVLARVARQREARDVLAVTLDVPGPTSDAPYVDDLARHLGVEVVHIDPTTCARAPSVPFVADDAPYSGDGSYGDACAGASAAWGADVMLTGNGGDELFGGVATMLGTSLFRTHPLLALEVAARTVFPATPPRGLSWVSNLVVKPLLFPHLPERLLRTRHRRAIARRHPWFTPALLDLVGDSIEAYARAQTPDLRTPRDVLHFLAGSSLALDAADGLAQAYRSSPVRVANPLLDNDLARLATCVRLDVLQTGGLYRGLLREALVGSMPERVRLRPGKSDAWAVSDAHLLELPRARELATARALAAEGLVDARRLSAAMRDGREVESILRTLAVEAYLEEGAHERRRVA